MIRDIINFRRLLHRYPELSGDESDTADRVRHFFAPLKPDRILSELGGDGVAFVFNGSGTGPTVLLRCELDALPIQESDKNSDGSQVSGVAHQCGHDGHMAILAAVGVSLAGQRPARGRVVLLYQPAEETGRGAAAVMADHRFADIAPDFAFALHNLPGYPLGQVLVRNGAFSSASRGMAIKLSGATAHAAQPETGRSPAKALCGIIEGFACLPGVKAQADEVAFVTVVGARLGEKAFGTAPGQAEIWATLRSETNETMTHLVADAEALVARLASQDGLNYRIEYDDVFQATVNSPMASDVVRHCASGSVLEMDKPFRWSEDFGHFTSRCEGALFGLGAGVDAPDLHDAGYRFPDELITTGSKLFLAIIRRCLAL